MGAAERVSSSKQIGERQRGRNSKAPRTARFCRVLTGAHENDPRSEAESVGFEKKKGFDQGFLGYEVGGFRHVEASMNSVGTVASS